jgi:hypothetical protein
LLWNCAWRATLWGSGLGTGLGAAYGAIAAPLGLMVTGILYARMEMLSVNPFLGVPAGMLPGIPIGIVAGSSLGFVAGTTLGVIYGALLCALTYFYFLKGGDATTYRRAAGIGGASVAVAVLVGAWAVLGFETNAFVGGGPPGTIDGGVADVVLLEIGPIAVAAWAARFLGKRVAAWCSARVPDGDSANGGSPVGTDF